jgi:type IV secretory pathway TraG/TraD family ATPase VirD4
MEHILRNALLTLIAVPGASLLSLLRLLADNRYREAILRSVADPVVQSFWVDEFGSWSERYRTEALAPVQNKLGHFLSSPILRAITGQAKSTIDLRRIMDRGQVLLVNLSKGRTGEDASALLGALLVTSIQQAAMSRADIPEAERRDFFLYVDEFQNFATDSFAAILSEARKYRLSLTLAHQFLAQLPEGTAAAVFGNVGSLVSFQVGPQDAETLTEQLGGDLQTSDLIALPRFTAYVRLLLDGMPTSPFSMETLPPRRPPRDGRGEKVRLASTHRYGRPLPEVEREIAAAMGGR